MTKHEAIWQDIEDRARLGHTEIDEQWRDVNEWEGFYQVSNIGRYRSVNRILTSKTGKKSYRRGVVKKPWVNNEGYKTARLNRNGRTYCTTVHKLVARAWLGVPPLGQQVRHGTGGRLDNALPNLCYGTPTQDLEDRRRDGTSRERPVRRSDGVDFVSIAAASRATDTKYNQLRAACNDRGRTAGGFGWEYILEERAHA
jgi:hypothetical protein